VILWEEITMHLNILFSLLGPIFHEVPGGSGAIEGFLHPLLGLDHLLAMVTVGLLSAQLGGRAIWTVPVTFVGVMAIGGVLGLTGIDIAIVEYGIAASVVVLGIALLAKRQIPEGVAMIFVGIFAAFHGFAHGKEIPQAIDDGLFVMAYVIGFLVATAGLHVIGALVGYIALRSTRGALLLRLSGLAVAVAGVILVAGIGS
jgi:urease accessory protein